MNGVVIKKASLLHFCTVYTIQLIKICSWIIKLFMMYIVLKLNFSNPVFYKLTSKYQRAFERNIYFFHADIHVIQYVHT